MKPRPRSLLSLVIACIYTCLPVVETQVAYVDIFNPNNPNNAPIELDEADVGTAETVCVSIVTSTAGTFSGTVMILGLDANGGNSTDIQLNNTNDTSSSFVFPPLSISVTNAENGTVFCAEVQAVDDSIAEDTEIFTLQATGSGTLMTAASPTVLNVEVTDNDQLIIGFEFGAYTCGETDPTCEVCLVVISGTLDLLLPAPVDIVPQVYTQSPIHETATSPEDFDNAALEADFNNTDARVCVNVMIVDDAIVELDETFQLSLDISSIKVATNSNMTSDNIALVTITSEDGFGDMPISGSGDMSASGAYVDIFNPNNPNNPNIELDEADVGTTETVCVSIVTLTAGTFSGTVMILGLDANGGDSTDIQLNNTNDTSSSFVFPPLSISVTDAENGTVFCAEVQAVDDSIAEDTEIFTLQATDSGALMTAASPIVLNVEITDNDLLIIGFEFGAYTCGETDPTCEVCLVVISGTLDLIQPAPVDIVPQVYDQSPAITVYETAATPEDFNNTALEADFSNTVTRVCVNVMIEDDAIVELDQTFQLSLNISSVKVATNSNMTSDNIALVTITSEDAALVYLSPGTLDITEGDSGTVNVTTDAMLQGEIIAILSTSDGTAEEADSDYSPVAAANVTLTPTSTTQLVSVTTLEDTLVELAESFSIIMGVVTSHLMFSTGSPITSVVTINDNDVLTAEVVQTETTVTEGTPSISVCFSLSDVSQLSVGTGMTVDLLFQTVAGDATNPNDFITASMTFFIDGDTAMASNCISILIVDDDRPELSETFTVALSIFSNGSLPFGLQFGANNVTTVTIEDNDFITIGLNQSNYHTSETAGSVMVCAEIIAMTGTLESDVEVTLTTSDGTATDGSDYNNLSEVITFTSRSLIGGTFCVSISIINDTDVECTDVFSVSLTTNLSKVLIPSDAQTASVTIETDQDDVVQIGLDANSYNTSEGGVLSVCVDKISATGTLECNVSVALSTSDGSAASGQDYGMLSTELVFTASTMQLCEVITIIDDDDVECDDVFTVKLNTTDSNVDIPSDRETSNVSIALDDTVEIGLSSANYNTTETSGTVQVCVEVTSMPGELECAVSMSLNTSDGSAKDGDDYDSVNQVLTGFTNFSFQPVCVDINITNDMDIECEDIFNVSLTSSDPVVTIASGAAQSTVTIAMDAADVIDIGMNHTNYNTSESAGSVIVCTELLSTTGNLECDVDASVSTLNGSAMAGSDYTAVSFHVLSFSSGSEILGDGHCVSIVILNDTNVECEDVFTVSLTGSSKVTIQNGSSEATVLIENDDVAEIGLQQTSYLTTETSGTVEVCAVLMNGSLECNVTVLLSTANGTATAGSDLVMVSKELTFSSGAPIGDLQCVDITILNDTDVECDDVFNVTLTTTDSSVDIAEGYGVATVTIERDAADVVTIGLAQSAYHTPEIDGPVEVCAEVFGQEGSLECNVTAMLFTADGSATAGDDYVAVSQALTFASGSSIGSLQCVNISIINDTLAELSDDFSVNLATSDTLVVVSTDRATVSIVMDSVDIPLQVFFVNESPIIDGNQVTVFVETNKKALLVTCSLSPSPLSQQDCTSGMAVFQGVPDGQVQLRVLAHNVGERDVQVVQLQVNSGGTLCSVYLINGPPGHEVSSTTSIQLRTTGSPRRLICSVDGTAPFHCQSPVIMQDLSNGSHFLRVSPVGCQNSKISIIRFNV